MTARAEAAEETRRRIIQAAIAVYYSSPGPEITLEQVAERSQVSVQTILRKFGTRAALLEAAGKVAQAEVVEERNAPAGDIAAAVKALCGHYARRGRSVLCLLAQETLSGGPDLSGGREEHRRWVAWVFGPQLGRHPAPAREALIDQLVVATDVYTWKLLCIDRGLNQRLAQDRIRRMVTAILGAG